MGADLTRELRAVRRTLLSEPVSPRVEEPADINRHHCRYVAETVTERLGEGHGARVLADGGRGYAHAWIYHDGRHYDAECVEGVEDHRDLPFFERHPEAAVGVVPGIVDPASLRRRGREPLYPTGPGTGSVPLVRAADRRYAVAGVLVGLVLFLAGAAGVWAIQAHPPGASTGLRTLFVDLEIVGELLAIVSPVVFVLLRPARRAAGR